MLIIWLDYVLRMSVDLIKENGFTLKNTRHKQYFVETMTNTDYTDDLMFLVNIPAQVESLLHSLEQAATAAGGIGHYRIHVF